MGEARDLAPETARMGPILKTGRDWRYEKCWGLGPEDCQDGLYTKDWGETGDMREDKDWAWETARMGPILKTRERLEIQERPEQR